MVHVLVSLNRSDSLEKLLIRNKDNRIGTAEFTLPPGMKGPPAHWHEMHDETFWTTKGIIRYHIPKEDGTEETIDANEGDYVVVPVRAPHTFSNPSDGESKFLNTYTPAYYINYFKLLGTMVNGERPITAQEHIDAMANYATLPVPKLRERSHDDTKV